MLSLVVAAAAGGIRAGNPDPPPSSADDPRRAVLIEVAVQAGESLWRRLEGQDPEPTLSCRVLFSSALALCEARRHPERIERLFELAGRMQECDPAAAGYGNFRWYWRDAAVTDPNAVEFCSYDMHLIWRLHRDWLSAAARESLRGMLGRAVDGCLRHRVRPSYTNIAILNAANLITLGEVLERAEAADEGYRRLAGMAADVWQFGVHEYCSPTYYSMDVQGLAIIERFARRDSGLRLAAALLELFWTDSAVNFFPAAERLAGTHSRSYDYLRGLGNFQQDLRWHGWSEVPPARSTEAIHVAEGRWAPPERLLELARNRFPRLVRQAWGGRPAESRTHWLLADVTLGCSGATYGPHDCPLTFDLPGRPGAVRGYFLADGREDPYGRKKYGTGAAHHPKALHLEPFWAGAQREADAIGLVVYREADLTGPEVVNLQSHFVMPRDLDGIWLCGRRLELPRLTAAPVRVAVATGDALVLRRGTAAVGIRVVWARGQDGQTAEAALVDDGNALGALRLTVEHRRDVKTSQAAAAFWVRVGGGLADEASFVAWRESFERAAPLRTEVVAERIDLAVPGTTGPVAITAQAPFTAAGAVRLEPAPSRAVLELDGEDIGRPLLAGVEPCASFAAAQGPDRVVDLPGEGGVRIEAEKGFVLPAMVVGDDGLGTKYVWQPDDGWPVAASGGASWRLRVPRAGRYWLWGRVLAPDGTRDSFAITVTAGEEATLIAGPWHLPRSTDWSWATMMVGDSRGPTPLDLPVGEVRISVLPREAGTKLDALWLTSDERALPAQQPP